MTCLYKTGDDDVDSGRLLPILDDKVLVLKLCQGSVHLDHREDLVVEAAQPRKVTQDHIGIR